MNSSREKIAAMEEVSLLFGSAGTGDYPACRLQKGLLFAWNGSDLSEEGVGFGVPVLRSGCEAIFPGSACVTTRRDGDKTVVTADYELNLVERMTLKGRRINSRAFYTLKEFLSCLHREYPYLRKMLVHASGAIRRFFNIETRFEKAESSGTVRVLYVIEGDAINISVDAGGVEKSRCAEIMLMNELGAGYFDTYHDSDGAFLKGNEIGTWDETFAEEASFLNTRHGIKFTLQRMDGAKLYRGRELVKGRLAWAGLAYSIPPGTTNFSYNIRIGMT